MDDLVGAAVEQVALAPDGCTVAQLWSSLRPAADEAGVQLAAPALRTALWRLLTVEPGLHFSLPSGRGLAAGDAELATSAAAEAAGVLLSAGRDLQDAAVGLYDSKLSRFSISDTQRKALALVGAAGRRGALQTDVAAALGAENRNFFYVVKMLEQRGLVVKHATVVKKEGGSNYFTSHVNTNLLHLTRFAPPNLGKGTTLTDGKSSAHGGGGGGGQPLGEAELAVLDDCTQFERICAQLQACAGGQADEAQLKAALGYRGQRGHRLWRRIKPLLVKRGHIEDFLARTAGDKTVRCIKLVKPWTGEDSASESEGEGGEEGQQGGPPLGRQVAEATLDRQLLRELVAAGPGGLLTVDVEAALRLNMKRNETRLKEAEARFGISRHAINQGRMITTRWTAPEALLERFSGGQGGEAPLGGWLAAVVDAIQAGLGEGEPFPLPQLMQQQQQQQHQADGQAQLLQGSRAGSGAELPAAIDGTGAAGPAAAAADGPAPQPTLALLLPATAADAGGGIAAAAAGTSQPRKFTLAAQQRLEWVQDRIQRRGFLLASEMGRYLKERAAAEGQESVVLPDRKTCDRVVKRGQEEGLWQVLTINFPSSAYGALQNRAHAVLAAPGTTCDEAFIEAVRQEFLEFKRRAFGSNRVSGQAERAELQGKELPLVELQDLVKVAVKKKRKKKGKKDGRRRRNDDDDQEAADAEEEEYEEEEEEEEGGEGGEGGNGSEPGLLTLPTPNDTVAVMTANGYSQLRMRRVQVLHAVLRRLSGLAPGQQQRGGAALGGDGAAAAPPCGLCFIVSHGPGSGRSGRTAQADLSRDVELASRAVTAQQVWEGLTVSAALEALGSSSPHTARVRQLAAGGRKLGQLAAAELAELFGGREDLVRARGRFMQLLYTAHRMGLLHAVMPLTSSFRPASGAVGNASYVVAAVLYVQEPAVTQQTQQAQRGAGAQSAPGVSGAGTAAADPQQPADSINTTSFDLAADPGAAQAYWDRLQWVVARHGSLRAVSGPQEALGRCFPFAVAPECSFDRAFYHRKLVTTEQFAQLDAFLAGRDAAALTAAQCREVADCLGMPLAAVLVFGSEHKRPTQRLGRLVVKRVERLGGRITGAGGGPNMFERRRLEQQRNYQQERLRRLQKQHPDGVPPERLTKKQYKGRDAASESVGLGGKKRRRGGAPRHRAALLPAADSEASDEGPEELPDEAELVDRSALLPRVQAAAPQRKKLWYRQEDRQLLTAWAGFLANHGATKMLLWRLCPGRPLSLKHATLKRRLQQLRRCEAVGQWVEEVRGVALRLHALQLEVEARRRAARERELEGLEPQPQQPDDQQEQQQQQQEGGGGQGSGQAGAGGKRPGGGGGGEPAAKRPRGADAAAGGGGAPPPALGMLLQLLPRRLQAGLPEEGMRRECGELLQRLAALVEQAVAAAPKQHKEQSLAHAAEATPAQRRRPGPKPLHPEAAAALRAGGGTRVAARPAAVLKHWAAALRGAGARGGGGTASPPGPPVVAALALAASLLYTAAGSGVVGAGYEAALPGRFPSAFILAALGLLRQQGALGPAERPLRLTDRWMAQLKSIAFPASIYEEAAAAAAALEQARQLDIPAEGGEAPVDGGGAADGALSGGAVAEMLGRMAAGRLLLRPHRVRVAPLAVAAAAAAAAGGDAAAAAQELTGELEVKVPVRAVLAAAHGDGGGSEGSAAGGAAAAGRAATQAVAAPAAAEDGAEEGTGEADGEGGGEALDGRGGGAASLAQQLRYTHQQMVLFQPSLVALSAEERQAAEAACCEAAAACGIPAPRFEAALSALRAAGSEGLAASELAAAASAGGDGGDGGGWEAGEQLQEQLLLHGLARRVASFDSARLAASEHSQEMLAFPFLPLPPQLRDGCTAQRGAQPFAASQQPGAAGDAAQPQQAGQAGGVEAGREAERGRQLAAWRDGMAAEVRRVAAALGLPAGGGAAALQPCLDVPLRPWADHHGRLIPDLWHALVRKAVAAATRQPGLPEPALLDELSVLAPQHARELLSILAAAGMLWVQSAAEASGPPPNALAACFGDASGGASAAGQPRQRRFYFAQPGASFGVRRVLPPQVLLPLEQAGG